MEKLFSLKTCVKMAGWRDAFPTPPPGSASARTNKNVSYYQGRTQKISKRVLKKT